MTYYRCYRLPLIAILGLLALAGCQPDAKLPADGAQNQAGIQHTGLDFTALLDTLDANIGVRMQFVEMDVMESATYRYDGDLQTVIDWIKPSLESSGFSEESIALDGLPLDASISETEQTTGVAVESMEHRYFGGPNGDMVVVSQLETSMPQMNMKMLTIQFSNSNKLPRSAEVSGKPQ